MERRVTTGTIPRPLLCWRSPSLARGLALGLALLTALGAAEVAAGQTAADEVRARRDRVLADPSLQTELPPGPDHRGVSGSGDADGRSRDGRERPGSTASRGERDRDWRVPDAPAPSSPASSGPSLGASAARILGWSLVILGGVAVLILLLLLGRRVWGSRRSEPRAARLPVPEEDSPSPAALPGPDEVDRLAQRGEYGAAIHLLLLQAVALVTERTGRRFPPGHTSRQVLATAGLQSPLRSALGVLVRAVERHLFGGRKSGATDFERCRDAFDTLTGGLVPEGGASGGSPP